MSALLTFLRQMLPREVEAELAGLRQAFRAMAPEPFMNTTEREIGVVLVWLAIEVSKLRRERAR